MGGKVVLAYSGGLDTSVSIKLLSEKYGYEVYTVTVDVGQKEDFEEIANKAYMLGVKEHFFFDAKREFIENFVFPAIKANALYEDKYPLSSALSRPLIVIKLIEVAKKVGADAVAHGCTGKGNDQIRFDVTIKSFLPDVKIIAPIRDWGLTRDVEAELIRKYNIPLKPKRKIYSVDENLWGRSIECGPLEDPAQEPPEEVFQWTVDPKDAPDTPEYVEIYFEKGVPVKLNGERLDPIKLISKLNEIAGKHGVGRIDHIEDRAVGFKSREVYETPAALTIIEAHKDLEKLVLNFNELSFKKLVDAEWTNLVYRGLWADPLREELEAFINKANERVSGIVRLKLYKGHVIVVGRSSPYSLYDKLIASYEKHSTFDQSWAKGFIELWGMPTIVSRRILERLK